MKKVLMLLFLLIIVACGKKDDGKGITLPPVGIEYYSIKVEVDDVNKGSIILHPLKEKYQIGEEVEVIVEAKKGYKFSSFEGINEDKIVNNKIVVDGNIYIKANFVEENIVVKSVKDSDELHQTYLAARSNKGNYLILVEDGEYTLKSTWLIDVPNVTLRGKSGDRDLVRIYGPDSGHMFLIRGDYFTVEYLTVGGAPSRENKFVEYHIFQIQGEYDADYFTIKNSRIIDATEQLIKVSTGGSEDTTGDYGLVEGNIFEFTTGEAAWWYTGGIDAHKAHYWVIRGNTFRNIHNNNPKEGANTALTEGAVHFWSNSRGTIVEKNIIINCDRGIMFGLDTSGHHDGIIRNNFIVTNKDVGIYLANATNTQIYNNTVYTNSGYSNGIEYRYTTTTGTEIYNNLTNRNIRARNGSIATLKNNITNAQEDWFVDAINGDLHLARGISSVVDKGRDIESIIDDIDGQERVTTKYDIGADEF